MLTWKRTTSSKISTRTYFALSNPHLNPSNHLRVTSRRPIDLNIHSDDEEILYGAPNSNPKSNLGSSHPKQTLAFKTLKADPNRNLNLGSNQACDFAEPNVSRVFDRGSFEDRNLVGESGIGSGVGVSNEIDDVLVQKDEVLVNKSENFGNLM